MSGRRRSVDVMARTSDPFRVDDGLDESTARSLGVRLGLQPTKTVRLDLKVRHW